MKSKYSILFHFVLQLSILSCRSTTHEIVVSQYPNKLPKEIHVLDKKNQIVEIKSFFFNGGIKNKIPYKNGVIEGHFQEWNSQFKLYQEGDYSKGKKEGKWISYFPDSSIASISFFKSGKKDSNQTFFFPDGKIREERTYQDDQEVGTRTTYFPSGKLKLQSNCRANSPRGFLTEYNQSSLVIRFYICNQGKPDDSTYFLDPARSMVHIRHLQNGLYHGLQETTDLNGNLLGSSEFVRGTGRLQVKCNSTTNSICFDSSFTEGEIDGVNWEWKDQLKLVDEWDAGKKLRSQIWNEKYLVSQGQYDDHNQRTGIWSYFHYNGKIKEKRPYLNGKVFGVAEHYNPEGKLIMKKNYRGKNQKVEVELLNN